MQLDVLDAGTTVLMTIAIVALWLVPIAIAIWLFRTLGAMVSAQRDIARHLANIEQHLRATSGRTAA